jgi:hypothetical protein
MEPATQHFGVPQLQADYIQTPLLQEPDQSRLILIDHDQIRADAEQIHIDPVAANALGRIIGIVSAGILHRWTVNDFPLFQDCGQSFVVDSSRIAENQARE